MQNAQQEIQKLQEIIHQYTTFFIIFDIIFFITIILIILFAIQYLKSKKRLILYPAFTGSFFPNRFLCLFLFLNVRMFRLCIPDSLYILSK